MRIRFRYCFLCVFLSCVAFLTPADADLENKPAGTIMDQMISFLVPASDALWAAEDPATNEEWQKLAAAAQVIIAVGASIKIGGSGPKDQHWAAQAEWQSFAGQMTTAAGQALQAIRDRDIDALYLANDALYQPCEGCHLKFNPAVTGE